MDSTVLNIQYQCSFDSYFSFNYINLCVCVCVFINFKCVHQFKGIVPVRCLNNRLLFFLIYIYMISWLGTWYKHFIILCAWWYLFTTEGVFNVSKDATCNFFCMKLFFCFPSPSKLINNDVRKQIVENKIWSNL